MVGCYASHKCKPPALDAGRFATHGLPTGRNLWTEMRFSSPPIRVPQGELGQMRYDSEESIARIHDRPESPIWHLVPDVPHMLAPRPPKFPDVTTVRTS